MSPRISYVIPTLNEEASLEQTLQSVFAQPGDKVVTIADGGSADRTLEIAASFDCRVVQGARGRGPQMNLGARDGNGDILLFLHADTCLPGNAANEVIRILQQEKAIAGSFQLSFEPTRPSLNFYARCSAINHSLFTYGDQGLFLRRSTFDSIGRYKSYPIFEDVELQTRLRRHGRFEKSSLAVTTSSRRFQTRGPIAQQLLNLALVAAYYGGVSPETLARFYGNLR